MTNWLVEQLPPRVGQRLLPFVFVGPAIVILVWFLGRSTVRALWISFLDRTGEYAGLQNYITFFTSEYIHIPIRNSLPRDSIEAAFRNGASHVTLFTRLVLPQSVPVLAALAVFQFIWV